MIIVSLYRFIIIIITILAIQTATVHVTHAAES